MQYKLLALDIDETLVKEATHIPSPKLYETLQLAAKKINISIVTARSIIAANQFLENIQLPPAYHALENGAKIMSPDGKLERDLHIPHAEVQALIDAASGDFLDMGLCFDSHWNDKVTDHSDKIVNGLSFSCKSREAAIALGEKLAKLDTQYSINAGNHWSLAGYGSILIFHKDATKGNGLKYIQDKLGIQPEETIAIGDGATDRAMYQYAGLKVAMSNGDDQLKEEADIISKTVDEDGVVEIIEKYILS
ncbi:MAG: HAD family hydrolase [Weeksellaceae bacterium]